MSSGVATSLLQLPGAKMSQPDLHVMANSMVHTLTFNEAQRIGLSICVVSSGLAIVFCLYG